MKKLILLFAILASVACEKPELESCTFEIEGTDVILKPGGTYTYPNGDTFTFEGCTLNYN